MSDAPNVDGFISVYPEFESLALNERPLVVAKLGLADRSVATDMGQRNDLVYALAAHYIALTPCGIANGLSKPGSSTTKYSGIVDGLKAAGGIGFMLL